MWDRSRGRSSSGGVKGGGWVVVGGGEGVLNEGGQDEASGKIECE